MHDLFYSFFLTSMTSKFFLYLQHSAFYVWLDGKCTKKNQLKVLQQLNLLSPSPLRRDI